MKQIPFVYRVHEEPNAEKLERLHGLLQACGVNDHFAKDVPTPNGAERHSGGRARHCL